MGAEKVLLVLYIKHSNLVLFLKPFHFFFSLMSKTHLEHMHLRLSCKTSGEK